MNNKTKIMKRKGLSRIITACIIAVGIGSLFSGCGSTTASKSSNSTNTANTTAQTTKATTTSNNNTATDNSSNNSRQANSTNSTPQNTTSNTTSTKKQTSSTVNSNPVVYYLKGSKTYYLSKTDAALKKSKNILSITLKQAKVAGMHQSTSKTS
ncbi:hypothetical protein [Clostridium pasteurianum]|uniref:Uncharacterized protein n=1 Tax=Clostridium pasteurianum BC1 TaxID=86416 RepID=R4K2L1_CLOPA|nr:hypothetical protein [Clostridium pasteurianum]AGK96823.1 hypothetical protein Clopa_1924 [Clostridium pasteurianum BC1]